MTHDCRRCHCEAEPAPGTHDARRQGCTCPADRLLCAGGEYWLATDCPLHSIAPQSHQNAQEAPGGTNASRKSHKADSPVSRYAT